MENGTQNKKPFGSKLNKILSNLERSIINQFGSASDLRKTDKGGTKKPLHPSTEFNSNRLLHSTMSKSSTLMKNSNEQKESLKKHHSSLHNEQRERRDKVSNALNELDFKLNARKLTLDGYKQHQSQNGIGSNSAQYISSPVLIHRNSYDGVAYVNGMNTINRLSIPPPHANDEARNQTHKLLFGPDTVNSSKSSWETSVRSTSVATESRDSKTLNHNSDTHHQGDLRSASNGISNSNSVRNLKSQDNLLKSQLDENLSLSTKHRSQLSNKLDENQNNIGNSVAGRIEVIDEKDIEESGFANYRSRRNQVTGLITRLSGNEKDFASKPVERSEGNNMIPSWTLVPNHNINNVTMRNVLSHSFNNRQHLLPGSSNNLQTRQTHHNVVSSSRRYDQNGAFNPSPMNLPNQYIQQFGANGGSMMSMVAMDDSQQIYANAPPKPLRYQYYDGAIMGYPYYPRWTYHPSNFATMSQIVPYNNGIHSVPLPINTHPFNQFQHVQQLHNGHHLGYRQDVQSTRQMFDSPFSLPVQHRNPNMYRLQNPHTVINKQDSSSINYYHNRQSLPYFPKSKSSLDPRDLMNFRATKAQQTNNILNSQQQLYSPRAFDGSARFSTRLPQREEYTQQSNLQRSKSVTHLLTDTYDCNFQNGIYDAQIDYPQQMTSNFATMRRNPNNVANRRETHRVSLSNFGNNRSSISATNLNMLCHNNNALNQQPSHYLSNEAESDSALSSKNSDSTSNETMGNKTNRQYQVSMNPKFLDRNRNSQLIVDLTTPRVLTKTQTTISSNSSESKSNPTELSNGPMDASSSDTSTIWSSPVNHNGAPPVPDSTDSANTGSKSTSSGSTSLLTNNESSLDWVQLGASLQSNENLANNAPYYYSDLESEEQRKALQNIFQQKNLSPPPQLLSRSTDQSSTRLAKSAAPHLTRVRQTHEMLPQVLLPPQGVACNIPQLI